ncbi:MerR family DNA-binding protein, partial [Bordetella pertussis]
SGSDEPCIQPIESSQLGQAGGLSLDEIRAMLSPQGAPRVDRQVLLAKADDIDATVKQLQAMSRGLRHAAACPAPSHAQCPTFKRLLKAAAAGALSSRRPASTSAAPRSPRKRAPARP